MRAVTPDRDSRLTQLPVRPFSARILGTCAAGVTPLALEWLDGYPYLNLRKHANAKDVLVTFGRQDGCWQLSVIGNGNGFGFEGTLAGAELMNSTQGAAVIKERVANLGGGLVLESKPYHGSHLLSKVPLENRMAHAE